MVCSDTPAMAQVSGGKAPDDVKISTSTAEVERGITMEVGLGAIRGTKMQSSLDENQRVKL